MNKHLSIASLAILILVPLSGCSGGNGGNGGGTVSGGDVDENAVYDAANADTGFKVGGTLNAAGATLATEGNGSAVTVGGVDNLSPDDSAGALDKADFLLDAREADGTHIQAELRSMTTGADAGVPIDLMGGVANNVEVNGDSGKGFPDLPKVKCYVCVGGLARVRVNEESLPDLQLVLVLVTRGMRGADGAVLAAADTEDLEFHVIFPGALLPGNTAFPHGADGFLYYFFENVKLRQLSPEDKGKVGEKLAPPVKPNVAPLAVAQVRLANGSVATQGMLESTERYLNVTLEASNSTDTDGSIEAYSWDIAEFNATGFLTSSNRTSGAVVNASFEKGGLKQISLRIIDDRGGIGNVTLFFFVDYHLMSTNTFADLQVVGANNACQPGSNCFTHQVSVEYGAEKMVVKPLKMLAGTQCNGPHHDVYNAQSGGTKVAGGTTADAVVEKDKLAATVGKWRVEAWYTAQIQCKYQLDAYVYYSPQVAPAA